MPSLPGAEKRTKSVRPVQSRTIDHSRSRPNPPPRAGSANKSKLPANLHGESRNSGADYLNQVLFHFLDEFFLSSNEIVEICPFYNWSRFLEHLASNYCVLLSIPFAGWVTFV